MSAIPAKTDFIASRRELSALVYVYAVISFFAVIFVIISYRASLLISDAVISHRIYFETHIVTVSLEIVIWVIIARAAVRLKDYSRTVIHGKDGQALDYIANALLVSVLFAILFSMASTVKTLFVHTPYIREATIVANHLPIVAILAASVLLLIGALKLNRVPYVKYKGLPSSALILSLVFYLLALVAYALYFYHVAPKLIDSDGLHHFALSKHVLLVSYVLPYALAWLVGLLACLKLAHYANNVEGKIYKPLFRDLYVGVMMIFIGTYLIQLFDVSSFNANRFGIGLIVLIGILLLLIKGCLLVCRGVSQLYLIEK